MADISAGLTPEGAATWAAIADLASRVPIDQWMVVGGQMVAIHAAELDRNAPRPTTDGDLVVDIRRHSRQAMRRVTAALLAMDFELYRSEEEVSAFLRGDGAGSICWPRTAWTIPCSPTGRLARSRHRARRRRWSVRSR